MKIIFESDSISIATTLRKGTPKINGVFFRDIKEKVLGKGYELSLVFVGTDRMRQLNKKHRGKDYATDILSFDLDDLSGEFADHDCDCGDDHDHNHDEGHGDSDSGHIHGGHEVFIKNARELKFSTGEILINPEKARSKAKQFDRSFDNYIKFLFVHGLMHLKGHDHEDDKDAERMEKAEKSIRQAFKI